jgi:hypothetical protein
MIMSHSIAHALATTACDRLVEEALNALQIRSQSMADDAPFTREEALAQMAECAQRATTLWRAAAIFIVPPLADAAHEMGRVRATYRVCMRDIGTHLKYVVAPSSAE